MLEVNLHLGLVDFLKLSIESRLDYGFAYGETGCFVPLGASYTFSIDVILVGSDDSGNVEKTFVCLTAFFVCQTALQACSRTVYAFSRDHGT